MARTRILAMAFVLSLAAVAAQGPQPSAGSLRKPGDKLILYSAVGPTLFKD